MRFFRYRPCAGRKLHTPLSHEERGGLKRIDCSGTKTSAFGFFCSGQKATLSLYRREELQWCWPYKCALSTQRATPLSSNVNLHHIFNLRALYGANLVRRWSISPQSDSGIVGGCKTGSGACARCPRTRLCSEEDS